MLERLLEYERDCFLAINGSHTWWLDHVMLAFASPWLWFPPFLLVLLFIIKRQDEWMLMGICSVLTAAGSSVITELITKPFFTRFRPVNHPLFMDDVRILNDYVADGAYGFISGHSANAFAFAVMSSLVMKNKYYSIAIFLWAAIMVYSRVYLAAHFITDVIPGIMAGSLIGWIVYKKMKSEK